MTTQFFAELRRQLPNSAPPQLALKTILANMSPHGRVEAFCRCCGNDHLLPEIAIFAKHNIVDTEAVLKYAARPGLDCPVRALIVLFPTMKREQHLQVLVYCLSLAPETFCWQKLPEVERLASMSVAATKQGEFPYALVQQVRNARVLREWPLDTRCEALVDKAVQDQRFDCLEVLVQKCGLLLITPEIQVVLAHPIPRTPQSAMENLVGSAFNRVLGKDMCLSAEEYRVIVMGEREADIRASLFVFRRVLNQQLLEEARALLLPLPPPLVAIVTQYAMYHSDWRSGDYARFRAPVPAIARLFF